MSARTNQLMSVIDNLEAALKSAQTAQTSALEALRGLAKELENRPGGPSWDWQLDGSGLEGLPPDVGVYTVQEVAKQLRLSTTVVYELVRTRQLPAMRFGGRIRITRRQLVAYMHGMSADEFEALIRQRVEEEERRK
jgi:excisionase family DNA binding protein